jgi:hypothetical protein
MAFEHERIETEADDELDGLSLFDEPDSEFADGKVHVPAPQPEEVSEFFTLDHEGRPALDYNKLGAARWAQISGELYSRDFFVVTNGDKKRPLRVSVTIGANLPLHKRAERLCVRPQHRLPFDTIAQRATNNQPLRVQFVRCYFEIPPGAARARLELPKSWLGGLRVVRNGEVVGGLAPRLLVEGQGPVPLAGCFLERSERSPLDPSRRRR